MKKEIFIEKKDKLINLSLKTNFVLTGKIIEVWDDCFSFRTKQKDSVISFDVVWSITEVN